jgi:hypothetical protein
MTLYSYGTKLTLEELARVATPAASATHKPILHIAVVEKLIEALGFARLAWCGRNLPCAPTGCACSA